MRVDLGASVRTSDGKDVGKIDKLVLDPSNGEVKSAVVRKGFLLPDDVEIPLRMLHPGDESDVRLLLSSEQMDDLPRFFEAEYTSVPSDYQAPYGYPPAGLLWPMGYPAYPAAAPFPSAGGAGTGLGFDRATDAEAEALQRKKVLSNAVIDEGSDVMSSDGEKVGEIHSVTFDTESGHPTELVVRKGFLFTQDLPLPAILIDSVDDGVVYLNVTKRDVEQRIRPAV